MKRKADDIAKLPVLVERRVSSGDWQRDTEHPFNNILAKPNRWMTGFEFWRYVVAGIDLRGNSICAIKRGWDGAPEELIPLNWDRVSVLLSPSGILFYNVSHPQIGWGVTFHQDDILHFRGLTLDGGYLGVTPVSVAQDVVGLAIATQQHGAVLFRQGAQVAGLIKHPAKLSAEASKRIAQSWQDVYGGVQNGYKTVVLEEGMSFEKLTMTNEDSQFLQTRAFQVTEVCRLFGVPPHKVYDLSKASFSSLEQQEQAYVNDTLDTLAVNIQDGTNSKVFFETERGRWRIRFDFDSLLRGDLVARSQYYGGALNNGWLSVNDVRRREGMPPISGGDTYRVPVNTQPIAQAAGSGSTTGADAPAPSGGIGSQAVPPGLEPVQNETADMTVATHRPANTRKGAFVEGEHPRDDDGKFANEAGSGSHGQENGSETDETKTKDDGASKKGAKPTKVVDGNRVQADGSELPKHIKALKIPPAWTEVMYSGDPDADLLVVGTDSKGRRQSVYSDAHWARSAAVKFARIEAMRKEYQDLVAQNDAARTSDEQKLRNVADCVALVMGMGVRPGSDDDTGAKVKAYGATTLEGRHVVETEDGVRLQFVGKKGVNLDLPVTDPALAVMLVARAKAARPGGKLFPMVTDKSLLDYVHTLDNGSFKTKDFRTRLATETAYALVLAQQVPDGEKAYKKAVMAVAKTVSEKLGNTPAIALQSYINPVVFSGWKIAA